MGLGRRSAEPRPSSLQHARKRQDTYPNARPSQEAAIHSRSARSATPRAAKATSHESAGRARSLWRNPKRWQWRNTLDQYVRPVLGELPVAHITASEVVHILERRGKAGTASAVRGRIEPRIGVSCLYAEALTSILG